MPLPTDPSGNIDWLAAGTQSLQQTQAEQIRNSMTQALPVNPDAEAQTRRYAAAASVPLETARAMPDQVKQQAQMSAFDAGMLARTFPTTARWLANPDNAKLAHDDIPNLQQLEQQAAAFVPAPPVVPTGFIDTLVNSFKRGLPSMQQNLSATGLRVNANSLATLDRVEAAMAAGTRLPDSQDPAGAQDMNQAQRMRYRESITRATGGNASTIAAAQAEKNNLPSPDVVKHVMDAKGFGEAVSAFMTDPIVFIASIGPESLVQNAPGLVAGAVVPGGAAMKAATMGAGSFSTDYGSSLLEAIGKQGVDINDAAALAAAAKNVPLMQRAAAQAMAHASVVGAVDGLSGGLASKLLLPARAFVKAPLAREIANLVVQTPVQGVFGGIGEAGGELAAGQPLDPGNILAEIVGEAFSAPAEVASIAGGRVRERMAEASSAKAKAAELTAMTDTAKASKLRERDANAFAALTKEKTGDAELFVKAETFAQSMKPEDIAALPEAITGQLAEALATGGDVAISVSDYVAHLADVPGLAEHMRASPDAMTATEAEAYAPDEHLQAEIEQLMPTPQADPRADALAQARQSVSDQITATGRFTPQVNAQYAALAHAFISTAADRNNLDAAGIAAMVPRIVSQLGAGLQTLGQGPDGRTEAAAAARGPRAEGVTVKETDKGFEALDADGTRIGYLHDNLQRGQAQQIGENANVDIVKVNPEYKGRGVGSALYEAFNAKHDGMIAPSGKTSPEAWALWKAKYPEKVAAFVMVEAGRIGEGADPRLVLRNITDTGVARQVQDAAVASGALRQEDRGAFEPSSKTVALLEHADLSTFLHESGHWFLHASIEFAAQENAPAAVKADAQTVLDWFGVKDVSTWRAMTLGEQRESHEKFARGFEAYLREGKAPTTELAAMFARFRGWLLSVYKMLASLNVKLTPEVRGVMDRMLATDAQIADTLAQRNLQPLFASAAAAGMTPEAFTAYQATGAQATEDAISALQASGLRDMQFIANSKKRALSKINIEARNKRSAIKDEVTAEVYAEPAYAAWRDLARGHTEDGQAIKLALPDMKENHAGAVSRIPHGMATNSGAAMPADMVAEAYGLSSGDELVKLLATLDKPADVIEGRVDQLMLERHGELIDERAIETAAHAAIANKARARVLTTEANALAAAAGKPALVARAAREYAEASVASRKVRDLRPGQFVAAEARAGREAASAFAKGDIATAAAAKRSQVLQHVLARTTADAVAEVQRAVEYLAKFDNAATRKAIGPAYADQVDQLLERVDLRASQSLTTIDKRKSLVAWVASQEEIGFSPAIDERLLNEAQRTSYKDMSVEELRGLVDTVKNIAHLGKLKERLLTARDKRAFAEVVGAVADSIATHGGKVRPIELEGEKGVKPWLQGVAAAHRKIGSLAYQMDGGTDNGPMFDALVRPMNEAGTREQVMIETATVKLAELYAPIHALPGGTTGAKVFIAEIGASLSRGGRLSVALNWGNEGNRQRLMDGAHWSEGKVQAILRTLSPVELQFVNDAHAFIDSYWAEIKAQQLRVSGVVEDKVQALPWAATANNGAQVQMTGGYYPAKYDTARSAKAESHDAAQVAKDMMQGAYVRATTRRGHTKARADAVKDRPLRLDLSVITQHVNEVTHNLAWQEWLIDANRLLSSKPIDGAIRSHYGPAVIRTLKDDLQGSATADVVQGTAIDQALITLRGNVTRSTLGASFTTALMQPFGLSNSMARIGALPVLRGLARWGGDAARFESSMSWVAEKSDTMRLRAKTMNRELHEISGRVGGKSKTAQVIDTGLMYLTAKAQQFVDIPTWIGRYEQAQGQGHDEGTSVALADEAVLSSQGGGQTKDLAEVQRKHPMLTQFYSYFSTTVNLMAAKTASTDFKNPKAAAGWLADMALLAVFPAIGPAVLTELLRGGGGIDPDKWLKKLAQWQASYLMSMVVGVRELSGLVGGFSYSGPPVSRIVTDVGKVGQQAKQGEIDEPAVLATARLVGDLTGIPVVQIIRSYKGWEAWSNGNAPVTSVLMGPPPKD